MLVSLCKFLKWISWVQKIQAKITEVRLRDYYSEEVPPLFFFFLTLQWLYSLNGERVGFVLWYMQVFGDKGGSLFSLQKRQLHTAVLGALQLIEAWAEPKQGGDLMFCFSSCVRLMGRI